MCSVMSTNKAFAGPLADKMIDPTGLTKKSSTLAALNDPLGTGDKYDKYQDPRDVLDKSKEYRDRNKTKPVASQVPDSVKADLELQRQRAAAAAGQKTLLGA